ncbi:MAG TPA: arginine deiminase-related protein [Nakamurella sp.]|nr:arginine deiminase-related protein [Nakamurella sp.]
MEQRPAGIARHATTRRYLMCRPTHFDVVYSINPWMDTAVPVDADLAMAQWRDLVATYRSLGHRVEIIEGEPGLPDMVFAANAATVIDGTAVAARFSTDKRTGEEQPYRAWLRDHLSSVLVPDRVNEGEGDLLWTGRLLLAGSGFRTDPLAHGEISELLGVPLVSLRLVDPSFYHLDTALAVLDQDTVAYYPGAFSAGSQRILRRLYPDAIEVSLADAQWFALNAVSDGRFVVLPKQAPDFAEQLAAAGFEPVPVDVSEFRKAGGGAKCCTLELRG